MRILNYVLARIRYSSVMGLINLKASLLRWCNNWHKAWNAWNTYQWERFKCSIKMICILWVVKGVFKYVNGLASHPLQLGYSFCLPFPNPFKGVILPLKNRGSHRVDLGCHRKSLRKPSLRILSQSEQKSPIWVVWDSLLILNTIPPLYLRAFALAISTTAFLKIAWSLAPSRPLRICSNVTLFLRPSMKQEPLTTHTHTHTQHSLCPI